METSSSHDLSIDSFELFEHSLDSTWSSQFSHSTPPRGQFNFRKPEIFTVPIYLKYLMKAPPLVSKMLSKNYFQGQVDVICLACCELSLYIPRHSNVF